MVVFLVKSLHTSRRVGMAAVVEYLHLPPDGPGFESASLHNKMQGKKAA
jgi:hypothetical protein